MSAPFFSIVIPCRDAARTIGRTLDSIAAQTETDREVVVVDGASTDGTLAILAAHGATVTRQVSAPDRGVYEAMNKGRRLAEGTWLLFLGADDILADPEVLARVRRAIGSRAAGVVCGEAMFDDGRVWGLSRRYLYRSFVHHQATFYHRSLLQDHGYDESLRMQADYDLNLGLLKAGVAFDAMPIRVAVCQSGGLSDGGRWANYREEIAVRHRHFPAWRCWLWDLGSVARYVRKRVVRRNAIKRPE